MPLFNEGDRFNGKPHGEVVNNPQHAAKLECAGCGKPFMQRPGKTLCPACYWVSLEKQVINAYPQYAAGWESSGDIEDNSPARQHPEGY